MRRARNLCWLPILLCLAGAATAAPATQEVALSDGDTLVARVYPASGRKLLVLVPNELGVTANHAVLAAKMAELGVETWITDLLEARMLPPTFSGIESVPAEDVADLVAAAAETGKQVYLLSSDRAAALVLYGAQEWLRRHADNRALRGILLMHPNLYSEPVAPGTAPTYLPIVDQAGPPLALLQPTLSAGHWYLESLVGRLLAGNNLLHLKRFDGVRDGFWYRDDASAEEMEFMRTRLPRDLQYVMGLLERMPARRAVVAEAVERPRARSPARLRGLLPHRGNPDPPPLVLASLAGGELDLADFRGKTVLVNFWAGWCPPCIEEMPSMQRLHERLAGQPFHILAVNMGEDRATIRDFLRTVVNVDFTILLDVGGGALRRWQVRAFPTSYLVGPDGRIRYSVFGSYEWDQPEALRIIQELMGEAGTLRNAAN